MIIAKEFEGQLWVRAADHQAENAALRADAERYRLARKWGVRTLVTRWGGDRYCTKTMEAADAAIDAAMQKENGK